MGREEPKDKELRVTSNTKKDRELIRYFEERLVLQQGVVSFTSRKRKDRELSRYAGESLVLQQGAVSFTTRKKEGQEAQ